MCAIVDANVTFEVFGRKRTADRRALAPDAIPRWTVRDRGAQPSAAPQRPPRRHEED